MMLTYDKNGYFLSIFFGLFVSCGHFVQAEVKSVSACHSSTSPTCNYITLECEQGSRIRILTMKYGVKDDKCNNRKNRCLDPNRDGCCAYNTADCMEYYSDLHAYNLYKDCSGKQTCGPLPVPVNSLQSCDGKTSTYVHVTYECLSVADEVKFCQVGNLSNVNGQKLSVVFDKSAESSTMPANCSCFAMSQNSDVNIDYMDIRMFRSYTSAPGSSCSSAELTSVPNDNFDTQCVNNRNEEINFKYGQLISRDNTLIEMKLLNLYSNGQDDSPQFVWLQITADDQQNVNLQCFKHAHQQTTVATTRVPSTTSEDISNVTKISATDEAGSNIGAIVAGILVPIILLAIIGAVLALLVWKRRGYLCKRKKKHATPNKYTDRPEIDNSVENSEYAEIGFVPDVACMEPNYDQVYEPKNKKASNEMNGHTYQNVGNADKVKGKQPKSTKSPLGKIKTHTDRLISFFRKQTENDFPQVSKRGRENSSESYDHLRPVSANSSVHIEIKSPTDEPNHTYSHTTDESVRKQVALNQEPDKLDKKTKASPKIEKRKDAATEELNAFHVGDAYIEFQFGTVDENHPNLVKCPKENNADVRPAPPTRPPPSPRTDVKTTKLPTPKASPKQTHNNITSQNEMRSKSPNCLSPNYTKPDDSQNYDYASGTHVQPRSASPRGSDISDVSSEHSYKILEVQHEVYDYAEVSDDEHAKRTDGYTSGSIYEDVEKNLRAESVRKHRSTTDRPVESNGYLEPVTNRTRVVTSPTVRTESQESQGTNNNRPKPQHSAASLVKRELKEKTQQKKQDKGNQVKNDNDSKESDIEATNESKLVKSDNVDAKDYQKIDGVKGVLKMAKLFENKDSGSDTSRQSSPRDLEFSNIPIGNKKKSSSNA